ncbi:hypothetical protein D5085_12885 [Ectothiorhodospiraceae bacterium BW-2]|nr:hypothetical protein D5085_12885 [Ectothiorhodospiraceae bacterium BW-2]
MAAVYAEYCGDAGYFAAEREARAAKLGGWAVEGGAAAALGVAEGGVSERLGRAKKASALFD